MLSVLFLVVPQQVEFDILMQYYRKLRDRMSQIQFNVLHDWFVNAGIITHDDRSYAPDIILTKMASHLLSGTCVLQIMFETLRRHTDIFHDLESKIQVALDQKLLTGMYVCT